MSRSAKGAALIAALALAVVAPWLAAAGAGDTAFTEAERAEVEALAVPLGDTPPEAASTELADFGQHLFFDRRLSGDGRFSCASCHQPDRAFTDGLALPEAAGRGHRNTPTLINVADNPWFQWDGAADSLWSQTLLVVENPRELDNDRLNLAHTLYRHADLRAAYQRRFGPLPPLSEGERFPAHGSPHAPTDSPGGRAWRRMAPADQEAVNRVMANLGVALAAWQRRLVRYDSPFDRFAAALADDPDPPPDEAFPAAARRGLKLFVGEAQCTLCHSGPDFSNQAFHNLGLPVAEHRDTGREQGLRRLAASPFNAAGPYAGDQDDADRLRFLPPPESLRGAFKTPSLRNVARTAPYFHDGRFATLEEAVRFYLEPPEGETLGEREGTLDLIPDLTDRQVADLVAFLKTLDSAPLPEAVTTPPEQR
ncbi:MAG: cytochrome c peroxidase [Alloalcanivorax venustensis]|jgi:cytochrome c peroxidase|uniref:cytochrome-c peroxidase n=1 Tax=Alloalcanivorax venustensis TaxID=172371 RepID=UPI0032992559